MTQLLHLLASSFNNLLSPNTTVIGQVEEVERADDDDPSAMSDPSPSPSLQPVPLSPATLPYAALHSRSLMQQTVLQTSAATLIDSCERLLGVVSQLRLHRVLHDRSRYGEEGRVKRERMAEQTALNARTRRHLARDVSAAIEALEAHYHQSAEHRSTAHHPTLSNGHYHVP